jgi:hypothetical protein
MKEMTNIFSNREIAIGIWLIIFIIYCSFNKKVRKAFINFIKSALNKKLTFFIKCKLVNIFKILMQYYIENKDVAEQMYN